MVAIVSVKAGQRSELGQWGWWGGGVTSIGGAADRSSRLGQLRGGFGWQEESLMEW